MTNPPFKSPTSSRSMHVPTSSRDASLQPNPHPYPIRTTAGGLLTRSSSVHNVSASRHHYVPLSPATRETRKRHRHTQSLTQEPTLEVQMPQPLPVPATFTGIERDRSKAAWNGSIRSNRSSNAFRSAATLEDLPLNPKLWSTSHLSVYLYTALRVATDNTEGVVLSATDVEDIIAFARDANINGRIFLRLIDEDLEKRGISTVWRDALLVASRNLRQNVIKGRIWGGDTDYPDSPSPSLPSHPFSSALYNSSSSSVDLTDEDEESYKQRRRHRGRVRGMVESFERSGSFSSESSFDGDSTSNRKELGPWLKDAVVVEESVIQSPVEELATLVEPQPVRNILEEPTVESLLEDSELSGSWGAKAWEDFDMAPGVTVKKVEESPSRGPQLRADTVSRLQAMPGFGSTRAAKSIRLPKGKQDRRVITAIFAPLKDDTPEDIPQGAIAQAPTNEMQAQGIISEVSTPPSFEGGRDVQDATLARELALETELAETRALVVAFKARLEEVERKVSELESALARKEQENDRPETDDAGARGPNVCEAEALIGHESDTSTLLEDCDEPGIDAGPSHRPLEIIPAPVKYIKSNVAPDPSDDTDPSSVSQLPQYVLLVGLGVCAVVLRVLLRRGVGRGPGIGWRP